MTQYGADENSGRRHYSPLSLSLSLFLALFPPVSLAYPLSLSPPSLSSHSDSFSASLLSLVSSRLSLLFFPADPDDDEVTSYGEGEREREREGEKAGLATPPPAPEPSRHPPSNETWKGDPFMPSAHFHELESVFRCSFTLVTL